MSPASSTQPALEAVGMADEAGDEGGGRIGVDLGLGADLLEGAIAHDRDAVAHGQRFLLIVRHVDEGDLQLLLVAADLHLHLGAQLAIEIGEGLVEQQERRARDQAARQRHPLLLAAGHLVGIAVREPVEPHQLQRPGQPLVALGARHAAACAAGRRCSPPAVLCGNSRKFWNTMPMWRA